MKKAIALSLLLISGSLLAHEDAMGTSSTAKSDMGSASSAAMPKKAKKVKKAKMSAKPKKAMEDKTMTAKKEHWVCPMHDGGESDHAGKCSKCGMDLVLEKDDAKPADKDGMKKM